MRTSLFLFATLTSALVLAEPDAGSLPALRLHAVPLLPSAPGRIGMDYLGYEPGTNQVWVPGANTGRVFVVDGTTESIRTVAGFPTREQEGRVLGPTSVTFGPGRAFIGNRADASVCAVDLRSLERGPCVTLEEAPDGSCLRRQHRRGVGHHPAFQVHRHPLRQQGPHRHRPHPPGRRAGRLCRGRRSGALLHKSRGQERDAGHRRARAHGGCTLAHRLRPGRAPEDGPRRHRLGAGGERCTDRLVSFALTPTAQQRGSVETGAGVDNIGLARAWAQCSPAKGAAARRRASGQRETLSATGQAHTAPGVRVR